MYNLNTHINVLFADASAMHLGTFQHSGALSPAASYSSTQSVTVPNAIEGNYTIYVQTDVSDNVYEHGLDSDNMGQAEVSNKEICINCLYLVMLDLCSKWLRMP